MTINGGVEAISDGLGIRTPLDLVQKIESQIENELSSLTLDAVINRLLADFDVELFLSYELGSIKPETHIYQSIVKRFNCTAEQCLFVGDTFEADYAGPRAMGMKAFHLVRSGVIGPHQISSLTDVLIHLNGGNK